MDIVYNKLFYAIMCACGFYGSHEVRGKGASARMREPERAGHFARNNASGEERIVYGKNPVAALLRSDAAVDSVFLSEALPPKESSYYTALAKSVGANVKRVPTSRLQKLCEGAEHQGVAARTSPVRYVEAEDLLENARAKGEPPLLVLCDGIQDPHNLGAIIRTSLLCGAHGIVIPKRGGVGVTGAVMKASAGAAAHLPIARVGNLANTIRLLQERGVFVYCADLDGQEAEQVDLSGAVALVLGSEHKGPACLTRKLCDGAVTLAMAKSAAATGIDSYNVSVAAGILLYRILRKRTEGLCSSAPFITSR